ncbi:hypothetical protein J40TS1_03060 [Paenibacillus montaniterrae]|uniref:YtkA-like domain-containing protein n=1 Tax=Paenibacillus montaniterrae TaxID=429341 RepID=A0A920CX40_9BACL|nr:hypothetical protein [Paenibacillus montaniterrae]GIP14664.1 hypothetical protein J40TS1_03060 [Paenibacillus montaniterrae]
MDRRRSSLLLILLALLLAAACLIVMLTSRSSLQSLELPSSIETEHYTIELSSPSKTHQALAYSEFELNITGSDEQQIELLKPVITLEMLHMDCGTVSAELLSSSTTRYSAQAAPLMKGVWVATATFQLANTDSDTITLHYQFEVI